MATKNLAATITIGGTLTAGLKGALGSVKTQLQGIGSEIGKMTKANKLLAADIRTYQRLGKGVDDLKAKYAATIKSVDNLRLAQKRLADAQSTRDRLVGRAGTISRVGAGATATGGAMLFGVKPMINAAIQRENEVNIIRNSGLSSADQEGLISAAKGTRQFGISVTDAFKTVRELQASLGSAHHAIEALPTALKAKSGLQIYNREHQGHEIGDDAMYSLAKIADERGGASSAEAMRVQMNAAFKGITASQGKVSAEDWLGAQRGAKAAGIGMTNDAFFGDSFMVQALGAPQYGKALSTLNNAWIGGHQDAHKFTNMLSDGLLDPKKVKTKNGLVTNYSSDALVDSKLFIKDQQAWSEKYLVPLAKKKNVDLSDSAAVQKFASMYTSNTNAGNILSQRLFNQTAIDRDRKNYQTAHGIDESEAANKNSTQGKNDDAMARYHDAITDLGQNALPLYTQAITAATSVLVKFNEFTKEHPALSNAMVVGIVAVGASLVVLGPLLVVAGGLVSAYAATQLALAARTAAATTAIEAQGVAAVTTASKLGGLLKRIGLVAVAANVGDYVAGKFGIGGKTIDQEQDDKNWKKATTFEKVETALPRTIETIGGFIGMTNIANEAQAKRIAQETEYLKNRPDPMPEAPPMRGASDTSAAPITQTNNFNITQQPGESTDALAKRIAQQMARQNAVRDRGALTDGASTQ